MRNENLYVRTAVAGAEGNGAEDKSAVKLTPNPERKPFYAVFWYAAQSAH
jgi:hypothetical protein